jgi:exopolysaccharide production protein ExoQ
MAMLLSPRPYRGRDSERTRSPRRLPKFLPWAIAAFLLVVLLRTLPFSERTAFASIEETGEGNLIRQVIYLLLFSAIVLPVALARPKAMVAAVPKPVGLFIGFCILSLLWSSVPDIAGRRAGLTIIIATCLLLAALELRPPHLLSIMRRICVTLTLLSLAAALLVPRLAFHQASDPEPAIVGALRGVFYHKNQAGTVAAISILLCLDRAVTARRKAVPIMLALLGAACLLLTNSRTSMAAVLLAAGIFFSARRGTRFEARSPNEMPILIATLAIGLCAIILPIYFSETAASYLADPEAFTGRGQLWSYVIQLIQERPFFGFGYESVFQVGAETPLARVATGIWILTVAHSHNGILDLLVSVGITGALLYFFCFIYDPLAKLIKLPRPLKHQWLPVFTSIIIFFLAHSLLEGRILSGESPAFVFLTLVAGLTTRLSIAARRRLCSARGRARHRPVLQPNP